ncbi:hypothetical protein DPMN_016372 [Dreissena polymorpha]|uniref:Uncharacterized protein n=1 Tax=Dreissena polymorpha TaxID=45954 RepID=A0A9D4NFI3_DREPO|nr:hypothetical protein DPMN_016372 [Dreissena polymorpha]
MQSAGASSHHLPELFVLVVLVLHVLECHRPVGGADQEEGHGRPLPAACPGCLKPDSQKRRGS